MVAPIRVSRLFDFAPLQLKPIQLHPVATSAVIMAPQQLSTQSTSGMYPSYSTTASGTNLHQDSGQVLGTLLLSPIKEMDSSSSNNTLIPGHPATAALAQAVMPTRLTDGYTASCKSTPSTLSTDL